MTQDTEFHERYIVVKEYPFRPGLKPKDLRIAADEVQEVDLDRCVLLLDDELVYLPGWPREELSSFCQRNVVKVRVRYDVWADLLAPFLDTSLNAEEVRSINQRLSDSGFSRLGAQWLRTLYAIPLILYQGMAGEWVGLYHYHLLDSLRHLRFVGLYSIAYRHTMRVALSQYHN